MNEDESDQHPESDAPSNEAYDSKVVYTNSKNYSWVE